jgi:MYXO-CTERM domain-containing protein
VRATYTYIYGTVRAETSKRLPRSQGLGAEDTRQGTGPPALVRAANGTGRSLMRAHTTAKALRASTAFRFGMMAALTAGVMFASSQAHAAGDVDPGQGGGSAPSPGGVNSSSGMAALKYEHTKGIPLVKTPGLGPSWAQLSIGIGLEPVKNGGPLFSIDMPKGAIIDASWGTDKKIVLKATSGAATDGTVRVRHSLAPSVNLAIDKWGIKANLGYDAGSLINKIPGARWEYDSQAAQQFAPWGFAAVDTVVKPTKENAQVFSVSFEKFPEFIADNAEGYMGLRAHTTPTFSYTTTKVVMSGADGAISNASGELSVAAVDGDYMELMTSVEGEMKVKGAISLEPFVHVEKVADYTVNADVGYPVYKMDYDVPGTKVIFQSALVHIPLPNVHAPTKGVDMGKVKVGGSASKTVVIQNSGEKEASMTFKSSDAAFSVPSSSVTVPPKGEYELEVSYSPDADGPASAEITVMSSDPDSPEQTFKVGANGADVGNGPDGDALPKGGEGDSGCGCKAAGSTSSVPSYAGFGALALGALVLFRRRRNAR